ncbi:chromate transporter [Streptomyces sp. NL15-2K]|uniref:chromate transporter n=1 Tax=Streptomyces sp. NL15-2K TaxID=376149 RepID=UPI000FFA83BD|nr:MULTISPECIES: chromate transporter [Actinomycetes]WKX12231.1 chromate transporter [Kutzneria buriramensis]GCB46273.1 chromate transport protein chrA [Streptomyces sp. NL15-2K]
MSRTSTQAAESAADVRDVVPFRTAVHTWFAITLFVLPGVAALLALSALYVAFGTTAAVTGLFAGLAPAVVAIVAQAVWRVGRRSLTHPALIALAVGSFAALALFAVPFPLVIVAAAIVGWLLARYAPHTLRPATAHTDDGPPPLIADDVLHAERPSRGRCASSAPV